MYKPRVGWGESGKRKTFENEVNDEMNDTGLEDGGEDQVGVDVFKWLRKNRGRGRLF